MIELVTVAIASDDEIQLADVVRSWAVPSEKIPTAVNPTVLPWAIVRLAGVRAIEVSTAAVTVTLAVPGTPARVAVMVALPTPAPVTRPWLPGALLMAARVGAEETHVASAVRFWVVPSEKSPVAVSCWLVPLAMEELGGVTVIPVSTAAVTVTVVAPITAFSVAVIVVLPTAAPVTSPLLLTVAMVLVGELQLAEAVRS